jgi:hypothetical protein
VGGLRSASDLGDRFDYGADLVFRHDVAVIGGQLPSLPDLVAEVRKYVPEGAHVRFMVSADGKTPGDCGEASGQLYWLVYHLLPRVPDCDPGVRWWVLYRTPAVPIPAGSVVVGSFPPGLRLVDTAPGRS